MSDNKPKPIPRKTPGDQPRGSSSGGKKNDGMTMREKIAARKKAEIEGQGQPQVQAQEQAQGAAPMPKAQPAPKSVARATPAKKTAEPAPKVAPKKPNTVQKAAPTAARPAVVKRASAEDETEDKPAKERPSRGGSSSRSSARRAGSGRGRGSKGDDSGDSGDDSGGTTRGRRARPEKKKKSPIPLIAAGVILIGGAGAYFGGVFDGDKTEAAGSGEGSTNLAGTDGADAAADADGSGEGTVPSEGDGSDSGSTDNTDGAVAGDEAAAAGAGAADSAEEAAEAKAAAKAAAEADEAEQAKARTDFSGLKPFGKPPEVTDEEWALLQEQAAELFDPFSGAAGGRSKKKLIAAGKIAWPAILNEMIKLDPDLPDQNRMGFSGADALDRARGSDTGRGFDWRHAQDSSTGEMKAKDLYFNKRLIIMLHEAWALTLEDPEHWAKYDKTDVAKEAAERAKEKAAEGAKKKSDEFDDLDLGDIEID